MGQGASRSTATVQPSYAELSERSDVSQSRRFSRGTGGPPTLRQTTRPRRTRSANRIKIPASSSAPKQSWRARLRGPKGQAAWQIVKLSAATTKAAETWLQTIPFGGIFTSELVHREKFRTWFKRQQAGKGKPTVEELKEVLTDVDVVEVLAKALYARANTIFEDTEEAAKLSKFGSSASLVAGSKSPRAAPSSKFIADHSFAELAFSDLSAFFGGLESVVGTPNPQIEAGLRDEHTKRHLDSDRIFVASNYKIQTMALVEWWFVADPLAIDGIVRKESGPGAEKTCDAEAMARLRMTEDERQRLHDSLRLLNGDKGTKTGSGKFVSWPREDRASLKASSKDAQPRAPSAPLSYLKKGVGVVCAKNRELRSLKSEELHVSELVAARLYTGPMFAKYNAVLRGLRLEFARGTFLELCGADGTYDKWERGELTFREAAGRECNLYPTTLLAINSAILKLSKLTPAQLVYRGVGDRTLPREFTTPNQYNVRGGVECAFMSATPDKNVALGYAQGRNTKTGIIFEMQQGMVDRGADISFLSQYPHEKEILFGPLTGVEVLDETDPRALLPTFSGAKDRPAVKARLRINLVSETIERIVSRNLKTLRGVAESMVDEVRLPCSAVGQRKLAQVYLSGMHEVSAAYLQDMLEEQLVARDVDEYNDDETFIRATQEMIRAKKKVLDSVTPLYGPILKYLQTKPDRVTSEAAVAVARMLQAAYLEERTWLTPPVKAPQDAQPGGKASAGQDPPLALAILVALPESLKAEPPVRIALTFLTELVPDLLSKKDDAIAKALGQLATYALTDEDWAADKALQHAVFMHYITHSTSATVRAAALTGLADVAPNLDMNAALLAPVEKCFVDANPSVRAAAVIAAGELLAFNPNLNSERMQATMRTLAQEANQEVRRAAQDVLRNVHRGSTTALNLSKGRGSLLGATDTLRVAARLRGPLDGEGSPGSPGLGEPEVHVDELIEALPSPKAAQTLIDAVSADIIAEHMGLIADKLLSKNKPTQLTDFLKRLSPDHGDAYAFCVSNRIEAVRKEALKGLDRVPPEVLGRHVAVILGGADDPEWDVRHRAVSLIGKLPTSIVLQATGGAAKPATLVTVSEALLHSDAKVREHAAIAAERIGKGILEYVANKDGAGGPRTLTGFGLGLNALHELRLKARSLAGTGVAIKTKAAAKGGKKAEGDQVHAVRQACTTAVEQLDAAFKLPQVVAITGPLAAPGPALGGERTRVGSL